MKEKILKKTGDVKSFKPEDIFSINKEYASKKKKIKINTVQKKETVRKIFFLKENHNKEEEIQKITNKVLQERQYVIDAALVRIFKSKKTMNFNNLIELVNNEIKLPITVKNELLYIF